MKRQLITVVVAVAFLANCGGLPKKIDPVTPVSPYDAEKTCKELKNEIETAKTACEAKQKAVDDRNFGNVLFIVAGLLLVWPTLFLIDASSKDDINYANSVNRYNYLLSLCEENNCETEGFDPIELAPEMAAKIDKNDPEHRSYKPGTQ